MSLDLGCFLHLCLTKCFKSSNFVIWMVEGWKRKENTNNLEEKRFPAFSIISLQYALAQQTAIILEFYF